MSPAAWALLALVPPIAVALLIAAVPPLRRAGGPAIWLSIGAATLAFAGAIALLAGLPSTGTGQVHEVAWLYSNGQPLATMGIRLDGISIAMLVVVTAVALAVQVYSSSYLHDEPPAALGRYYACQSLFLFAMNLLVLAPNLLQLFIGWELVGVASYLLIGYWYAKPSAARAALKAFWITKLADSGFIIALVILHRETGSFSWEITAALPAATVITMLLFFAVMGKSAQFPLHVWLPDAMEGPTPVSALLHAATMVAAGVYLVVRAFPLFELAPTTLTVMAHVGAFTALFAGCVAVAQNDIKKILAYSTCSQLGAMFAGLGAGSQLAGFFHLTTHAAFKAMLFLAAGSVIHAVHSNELGDMGGLAKKMKLTATAFIVGALALAGVPGLAGFASKEMIIDAIASQDMPIVLVLAIASAGLTSFYMGRCVILAFFNDPALPAGGPPSKKAEHAHEPGLPMLLPVLVLLVPTIALGFFGGSFAGLLGEEHHARMGAAGYVATAVALAGLGMAWLVFGTTRLPATTLEAFGPAATFVRSGHVDRLHLTIYQRGLRGLGSAASWIDRYIIDSLMNVIGWIFVAGGRALRVVQTGNVADYVWAVLAAATLLVAWGATR